MKITIVEIVIGCIIFGIIGIMVFGIISGTSDPNTIQPASFYKTVEYNGHTYIENYANQSIVHNPDCTNSKCFKE